MQIILGRILTLKPRYEPNILVVIITVKSYNGTDSTAKSTEVKYNYKELIKFSFVPAILFTIMMLIVRPTKKPTDAPQMTTPILGTIVEPIPKPIPSP